MNAQDRSGRDAEKKGMNRPDPGRGPRVRLPRAPRFALYLPATEPKAENYSLWARMVRESLGLALLLVVSTVSGALAQAPTPRPYVERSYAAIMEGGPSKALASNRVVRVVDGDTVDLNRGGTIVRCRLIGVKAPESTTKVEPYGPEATSYLRGWIEGKVVRVDYERRDKRGEWERDRYGRLLVYLFADQGRQNVNLILIERGQARFERGYPTRYRSVFSGAEEYARFHALGLWNPAYLPVGDPTPEGSFPHPVHLLTMGSTWAREIERRLIPRGWWTPGPIPIPGLDFGPVG